MRDVKRGNAAKGIFQTAACMTAAVSMVAFAVGAADGEMNKAAFDKDPYPSTYEPRPSADYTLIRNATVLTGAGEQLENASVLIEKGKIKAVGQNIEAPDGAVVVDASGKWVTPGIIDVHSHLGAWGNPGDSSLYDGNEATSPVTAEVWVEHSIWPQDAGYARALEGGVTTLQVLPGSANLIGGRGVTLKVVPSTTREGMKFPGAPYSLKMACGENPKRVYGQKGGPSTRMGNQAGYRKAWIKAQDYKEKWDQYEADVAEGKEDVKMPSRDLELDTLAGVLSGEILVHNHCYRADEMATMINMSKEFGYKISTFHHAVESYKIADLLKEEGICSAMWADWWGFKIEAFDGIDENVPMVAKAGACAIVHSDDGVGIQRLNQEAAKAWADGKRVGIDFTKAEAFSWITLNAANALGIGDKTGSLEAGKMADVVIWSGDPFNTYTRTEKVFIDGAVLYDRSNPETYWQSDFETGQVTKGAHK